MVGRQSTLWIFAVPLAAALGLPALSLFSWSRAPELGVTDGQLAPCPASRNAVSSQTESAEHRVAPIRFDGDPAAAMQRLADVLTQMPRTRIVTLTESYLRAECVTPLMRFMDDVEFVVDPIEKVLHVRSASRVGYSDMGTNRTRVEHIRALFADQAE